jgi:hypothetical protein
MFEKDKDRNLNRLLLLVLWIQFITEVQKIIQSSAALIGQ